jgi:D-serine deaminase-like pyridoxal phosphate-dependent protein
MSRQRVTKRLGVLIELPLGVVGGRTGARSVEEALQVARAASATPSLRVVGVSGFEGIIGPAHSATAEDLRVVVRSGCYLSHDDGVIR